MEQLSSEEINDLLVAYALDALEPEAIEQVNQLLRERSELRAELDELRATVEQLPYALPAGAPPADLRARALNHAFGRSNAERMPAPAASPWWRRIFSPAGLAFALGLALALTLTQLIRTQQQLAGVQAELLAARSEAQQIAQAVARSVARAALSGEGGSATALVSANGELLLLASLPQLEAERVYQLWVIAGDGTPQSAGVFTVGSDGTGRLIAAAPPAGATLAITNEPSPGSPGPTTPILAAGTIS